MAVLLQPPSAKTGLPGVFHTAPIMGFAHPILSFLALDPPFCPFPLPSSLLLVDQPAPEALSPLGTSSATSVPKPSTFDSFTWVILALHGLLRLSNKRF